MKHWKFVLFGITGDLAHRYILPALAKFAELKKDELSIELIGYSRSKPDCIALERLLNENTTSGKHYIAKITDIQGSYEDPDAILKLAQSLQENEELVSYFAIPPAIYLDLIKSFSAVSNSNITLLIEKPIGTNLSEAQEIFEHIKNGGLEEKVHFIDHVLFKSPLTLLNEDIRLVKDKVEGNVHTIHSRWLEAVGVEGRGSYYDVNGALIDMFPSHMVSLVDRVIQQLKPEMMQDIYDSFEVTNLILGQYEGYVQEIGKDSSTTETYFLVEGFITYNAQKIKLTFESGKKIDLKETSSTIMYEDNCSLSWNITSKELKINQQEPMKIAENALPDHVNIMHDVYNKDISRFFSPEMVLVGWKMYEKVMEFKKKKNILTRIYRENQYPIQFK